MLYLIIGFLIVFVIIASLFHLAHAILLGLFTALYGKDKATDIVDAIGTALRIVTAILVASGVLWLLIWMFGPVGGAISVVVIFAVILFFKSFSN